MCLHLFIFLKEIIEHAVLMLDGVFFTSSVMQECNIDSVVMWLSLGVMVYSTNYLLIILLPIYRSDIIPF
jgi:hypothetical protein